MHLWVLRAAFVGLAAWLCFVAWAQHDLRSAARLPGEEARLLLVHPPGAELAAMTAANLAGRYGAVERRAEDAAGGTAGHDALLLIEGAAPPEAAAALPRVELPADPEAEGAALAAARLAAAFGAAEPARPRAIARLGPVGPDSNPRRLRAAIDLLAEEGVPFALLLDDGLPGGTRLSERAPLAAAVHHARGSGGRLVATVSGVPNGADPAWWETRLDRQARMLRAAGLPRPRLFSMPEAAASPAGYDAVRARFPARYERTIYFAQGGNAPVAPFLAYPSVDVRGDFLIPLQGAASGGSVGPAADAAAAVPGAVFTLSHDLEEAPERLRAGLRVLRARGFAFVDPERLLAEAPPHGPAGLRKVSRPALAAAGWVRALPHIDAPLLVALLGLLTAMALAGEAALIRLGRPRRPPQYVRPPVRRASA
jgi:hypothetical protein